VDVHSQDRIEVAADVNTAVNAEIAAQDQKGLDDLSRASLGRCPSRIENLLAGLGTRRFYRLHFDAGEPRTIVARIEDDHAVPRLTSATAPSRTKALGTPPIWRAEPPLEPLRGFLEDAGLPVPKSHGHFPDLGIDLLEDVGERTLAAATGDLRRTLYAQACGIIPRLQSLTGDPTEIPAFDRRLDRALIETKAWKWLHWTIPLILGREPTSQECEDTGRLFSRVADLVDAAPRRLSHRDFKAENLHWLSSTEIPNLPRRSDRLVMIDVQGAFMAPPEYDLVCLLYDLQVELDEAFVREAFEKTRNDLPDDLDPADSALRFDALAVVRLCKDVSHVVHAGRVRGDMRRWREIPRGIGLIELSAGRIERTLPEIGPLRSVIYALSQALEATDSEARGE
jgi:aminoglycoside/choline kinase family phosphotransferase